MIIFAGLTKLTMTDRARRRSVAISLIKFSCIPDQSAQSKGKMLSQCHCHPPHPHTCGGGSLWRIS